MTDEFTRWKAEQAAEWLDGIAEMRNNVDAMKAAMDALRESAMPGGISYDAIMVDASSSGDAMEKAICDYVDGMLELSDWAFELRTAEDDAIERLGRLGRDGEMLYMRHVECRTWAYIGARLGLHPDTCRHMDAEALAKAYDEMPEEMRTMVPRAD